MPAPGRGWSWAFLHGLTFDCCSVDGFDIVWEVAKLDAAIVGQDSVAERDWVELALEEECCPIG